VSLPMALMMECRFRVWWADHGEDIRVIIPPHVTAMLSPEAGHNPSQRDQHILLIAAQGRLGWQKETNFGQPALVETAMGRYKASSILACEREAPLASRPPGLCPPAENCRVDSMRKGEAQPSLIPCSNAHSNGGFLTNSFKVSWLSRKKWPRGQKLRENIRLPNLPEKNELKTAPIPDRLAGMESARSLTEQLHLYSSGHTEIGDSLLRQILPRLRQIAARRLSREPFTPVTPTELINETWVASLHRGRWKIESREHFFNMASLAMENVLIDLARRRLATRRGKGAPHLSFDEISPNHQPAAANAEEVLAIGILMEELKKVDAKAAFVVRAHYIVGFSLEEIAAESGLTLRQVRHRWEKGKVWLATRLLTRRS